MQIAAQGRSAEGCASANAATTIPTKRTARSRPPGGSDIMPGIGNEITTAMPAGISAVDSAFRKMHARLEEQQREILHNTGEHGGVCGDRRRTCRAKRERRRVRRPDDRSDHDHEHVDGDRMLAPVACTTSATTACHAAGSKPSTADDTADRQRRCICPSRRRTGPRSYGTPHRSSVRSHQEHRYTQPAPRDQDGSCDECRDEQATNFG